MSTDEKQLLKKVIKADQIAFRQLFNLYFDTLYRFVIYRVKDDNLAQDIVQETFLRVWNNRNQLDPEKSFFSLIAKIGANLCNDHFRHQEVRTRHKELIPKPEPSRFDDPQGSLEYMELREAINRAVYERLPDKCRDIFVLSRMEELGNQEIADILNLSRRTVENQLYRALKILKKHLKNYL